ncbi:MAG: S-layer homology domain-containing protein [Symploca sp. SIO1C2]|nr:S-layer homology domain-containing protein [Symploca sp. SIO1C2]
MSNFQPWQSGTAAFLAFGLSVGAVAPLVISAPGFAQTSQFSDVSPNYWASNFINELSNRDIIAGFPDGSFKPNAPVTRAQYAAMLRKANQYFNKGANRNSINFVDVPSNYWAAPAIQEAYTTQFLSGYPGRVFRPQQNIPREQVLVSLASGLNFSPVGSVPSILNYYNDVSSISNYATTGIAAATEKNIVVNYPNLSFLRPTQNATRAEVAAFIYQALVNQGKAPTIASQYIVDTTPIATEFTIPSGTVLPVRYEKDKILLTEDETVPLTLTVDANITTPGNQLLIPAGSQVEGKLVPVNGGTQFVAETLKIGSKRIPIGATSEVIDTTETITKGINVGNLVKNAALGTAAAAAISAVTGDRAIATEELLIGGGAGVVVSLLQRFLGRNSVDLLVIEPDTDLDLTLSSDLKISTK